MADLARAAKALAEAKKIVCFSGAGISAESGIATYLDRMSGPWVNHDPRYLETAKAFRETPMLVWGWYLWRRRQVARAQPNAAHLALAQMSTSDREMVIITQNVDDLHERAGSKGVIHLHGSLAIPKCFACHRSADLTADQLEVSDEQILVEPPRCKRCCGKLRPGVVWYGEDLPAGAWKSAISFTKGCDVLISVGTSGTVNPAATLPRLALAAGASVIHINTVDVGLGHPKELMVIGKATEVLAHLRESLLAEAKMR